jgi:hypothetical protein
MKLVIIVCFFCMPTIDFLYATRNSYSCYVCIANRLFSLSIQVFQRSNPQASSTATTSLIDSSAELPHDLPKRSNLILGAKCIVREVVSDQARLWGAE